MESFCAFDSLVLEATSGLELQLLKAPFRTLITIVQGTGLWLPLLKASFRAVVGIVEGIFQGSDYHWMLPNLEAVHSLIY